MPLLNVVGSGELALETEKTKPVACLGQKAHAEAETAAKSQGPLPGPRPPVTMSAFSNRKQFKDGIGIGIGFESLIRVRQPSGDDKGMLGMDGSWDYLPAANDNSFSPSGRARRAPFGHADTDMGGDRYEDGEVRRFGAGVSYRPNYNRDRSPRPGRSPSRDRGRTPPGASDRYVPNRSPRRRSRSQDRFRPRDRSRDGGESWRPRERERSRGRARSPMRPSPPRRSPPRRLSPPRFHPRDDRHERARSPRRNFDSRDGGRRSRSPYDSQRASRNRLGRSPPTGPRVGLGPYRRGSGDARDERPTASYSSHRRPSPPPRDSVNNITSPSASRRSSPRPNSFRPSPVPSPQIPDTAVATTTTTTTTTTLALREAQRPSISDPVATPPTAAARSPPRGPAALRAPPTGPSVSRSLTTPAASPAAHPAQSRFPQTPTGPLPSPNTTSPTMPPSGPRGYMSQRGGGYVTRGGRGAWPAIPSRSAASSTAPSGPGGSIPTGPRAASVSSAASSPSMTSRPFNPPTGPAAHNNNNNNNNSNHNNSTPAARPALAQTLLNSMPVIVPGGKLDPVTAALQLSGVAREMEPQMRKLRDEEERVRDELRQQEEKLRRSLRAWSHAERESKDFEHKTELSEKSLKKLAGEGIGGAAF